MVGESEAADAATQQFCDYWENEAAVVGSVLVYNTGRSLGQFIALLEDKAGKLALPDVLITAVGTKVRISSDNKEINKIFKEACRKSCLKLWSLL